MYPSPKVRKIRARAIPAVFALGICVSSLCGASVCEEPGTVSYISAGLVTHHTSALERELGRTEQENQDLQVLANGPGNFAIGFSHRYTKFDFEGIDPQTNAHLHTSAFPLHWQRDNGSLRVSIAPTLSASSNVLGHPQKYRSDTLQLALAAMWQQRFSETLSGSYGLCGDDRLGDYRLYPAAGIEWQPHPDWKLNLGFPASRITYRIGNDLSTELNLAPDGSEWHVMDRSFSEESLFIYESWAVEWRVAFEAGPHLVIAAGLGRQFRNRFEMTLRSGERIAIESDSVNRTGAEVQWRF
jgi:hypothetical protein